MDLTVFFTVLSGVVTYVLGQIVVKLVIEPVQDLRRTIGAISHALIERANVIQNPGVPREEMIRATSQELRKLSSQLTAHLYLVPRYGMTSRIFRLPSAKEIRTASTALIGLSNSLYEARPNIYEINDKRIESICDSLGIYMAPGDRWPKD